MLDKLAPCPFCGEPIEPIEPMHPDIIYPDGIYWRDDKQFGFRTYHYYLTKQEGDSSCWAIHCTCGAELHKDTKEELIAAWNTRYYY